MPDLSGKVALVTSANTGLGLEVAMQLALANVSTLVLACRNENKCEAAARKLEVAVLEREDQDGDT
jgi:NAD(P)-dependent dehydrogenase (short-subunit alcohol dehydrogenase family)